MEKIRIHECLSNYESPTLRVVVVELEVGFVKGSRNVPISTSDKMWVYDWGNDEVINGDFNLDL